MSEGLPLDAGPSFCPAAKVRVPGHVTAECFPCLRAENATLRAFLRGIRTVRADDGLDPLGRIEHLAASALGSESEGEQRQTSGSDPTSVSRSGSARPAADGGRPLTPDHAPARGPEEAGTYFAHAPGCLTPGLRCEMYGCIVRAERDEPRPSEAESEGVCQACGGRGWLPAHNPRDPDERIDPCPDCKRPTEAMPAEQCSICECRVATICDDCHEEAVDHYIDDKERAHCLGCCTGVAAKCPGMPRPATESKSGGGR